MNKKFYLLVDETGRMSMQNNNEDKFLLMSIVKIEDREQEETFNNFLQEYSEMMERECGGQKKHLKTLFDRYGHSETRRLVLNTIEKYMDFIKNNIVNIYVKVGYTNQRDQSVFHTIDAYLSSLYYLFHNAKLFIDDNKSTVYYAIEQLQYIVRLRKFLESFQNSEYNQNGSSKDYKACKEFHELLTQYSNVYNVDEKLEKVIPKVINLKKDKDVKTNFNLIPDLFVSGKSFLSGTGINYIKLKRLEKAYIPEEQKDYRNELSVTINAKYNAFRIKIPSNLIITFNREIDKKNENIHSLFCKKFGIDEQTTPFQFSFDIESEFDKDLIRYIIGNGQDFNIDIKSTILAKKKDLLTKYIADIAVLGKLDFIDLKALRDKFGVVNLPQIDLSKKISEDLNLARLMSLLLEGFYEDKYDKNRLSLIDKYPLIKYVYLSNIAYKNPDDQEVINQIEDLEKELGERLISILNYDAIHQKLNKMYIEGRFSEFSEQVNTYRSILLKKITNSPWLYRRRYLNLFGKVLTEFYRLDIAENVYRHILENSEQSLVKEIYRTKGSLAEVLCRKGNYKEAINLYEENLNMDISEEEKIRTKSQLIYPLFFEYMNNKEESYKEKLEEMLFEVKYYYEEKPEILYPILIELLLSDDKNLYYKYSKKFNLGEKDPLNLPVAILKVAYGETEDAINKLEKAGFIIELIDLLNSDLVDKRLYEKKIDELKKEIEKNYPKEIESLLSSAGFNTKDEYQKHFFKRLFDKNKKELITFRMNLLNYLKSWAWRHVWEKSYQ